MKKIFFLMLVTGWGFWSSEAGAKEPIWDFDPRSWISKIQLSVPSKEILPNGLEVVWFPDKNLPLVDMILLVKSGYRHDPAGKTGTVQLLTDLLDRGAGGLSARELVRSIEKLGASHSISAGDDTTTVGIHGLSEDREALLALLAQMVLQPDFPQKELEREKTRFLDRWSHIGDHSQTLASLTYRRILTSNTIYSRGGFFSRKEYSRLNRSDLVRFHRNHFVPNDSILVLVGDLDPGQFRARVNATFGQWNKVKKPSQKSGVKINTRSRLQPNPKRGVLVNRKDLKQAQIRMGFEAPPVDSPEHYALVVANALLGEHYNSRLNQTIRDDLSLTYAIDSSFSYSLEFSTFTITTSTRNELVGDLISKVLEILKDLKKTR